MTRTLDSFVFVRPSFACCLAIAACNGDLGSAAQTGSTSIATNADDAASASGSTGAAATSAATSSGSAAEDDAPSPVRFDLGSLPDAPPNVGGCGGNNEEGELLYSYIWIANSSQGTVSKIDTETMQEVGRYRTHPVLGDPSRTSVSLSGNVAVANRNGGLVKFYASVDDCEDRNGDGQIQTSTGPNDVLPWDEEECRAWFTPFDYSSQRPVAWTPGTWNASTCRYEGEKIWTSGANDNFGDATSFVGVHVILVDGDTGTVEQTVHIPEVVANFYGIYGGAVDADGNFWGSQLGTGRLVRVDLQTFEYETWPMAAHGYGMTVDSKGYVWTCALEAARFDPQTQTWQTAVVGGNGGCMEDGNGTLWLASNPLVGIDVETLQIVASHSLPEYVHGVSVDFAGHVWGVSMSTLAYRVDPATGAFTTVGGLIGPYTYSDMTGFALANAGGGTPSG